MIRHQHNPEDHPHSHRPGAVTVEFALVVPIALMLTFGLIEFARANMIRNTVDNAAYEGARTAIVPGGTADRASTAAQRVMQAIGTTGTTVTVDPPVITNVTPTVTVTVSVPLEENMWVTPKYFADRSISKSCTLSRENVSKIP